MTADAHRTMRAIAFDEFGGPDVLRVVELPVPTPEDRQALVRVHAASVNPTDTIFRSGQGYAGAVARPAPWVPGMDFSGVIEVPGDASRWSVGDRVFGVAMPAGRRQGAYADYVVAPDDALAPVPAHISFTEASTLAMNGLTALRTMDWLAEHAVRSVAVTGAAGAVGTMVIELAKDRGLHVVADASDTDLASVRAAGADLVLPRGASWPGAVLRSHPDGVDALVDAGIYGEVAVDVVRTGGCLALLRPAAGDHPNRGITVHTVAMTDYYRRHDKMAAIATTAGAGILGTRVAAVLPPAEAARAHEMLEDGGVRGRLVLDFSPDEDEA